jgi:tetratricopeptide (TPR) repeat protein
MNMLSTALLVLGSMAPQEPAAATSTEGVPAVEDAERWLMAAEMCYWAALEDYGAPELLRRGQAYLERLDGVADPAVAQRRDELNTNFDAQLDMAHDTLRGVFPGYRILREGVGPEVLVDDPWVISTVNASKGVSALLRGALRKHAQFDLRGQALFQHGGDERLAEAELRPDLLNEAFYVLSNNPRLWIDPTIEPAPRQLPPADASDISLHVQISDLGTEPPLFAVTLEGELSVDGVPSGEKFRAFGFAHDHRKDLHVLALWLLGFLLAALLPAARRSLGQRKVRHQELRAAAGAFVLGVGVTGGLIHTFSHLLPAPDELVATGLWGPLVLALASTSGPLLARGIAPIRLKEFIPGLQYWTERELGAWPTVVGGGVLLFGAVALEIGWIPAAALAALWLMAQHHGTELADRGIHLSTAERSKILIVLAVALALGVVSVPMEDWNSAAISWLAGGVVLLLVAFGLGSDAMASIVTPAATLALLAGLWPPMLVLGAAPSLLRLNQRGRRVADRREREAPAVGATLGDRLQALQAGGGLILDAHREQIESEAAKAVWRQVGFVGGAPDDRRFLAEHGAAALVADGKPVTLRLERDSASPFAPIQALLPRRGSRLAQLVMHGLANMSPIDLGEVPSEDGPEVIAKDFARWISEGHAPSALAMTGSMPPDLEEVLGKARTHFTSQPGEARITIFDAATSNPSGEGSGRPGSVTIDLGDDHEDGLRLRRDVLETSLGLSAELAGIILEESEEEGASLPMLVAVLVHLVKEAKFLNPEVAVPVPRPPVVLEREFREAVRAGAKASRQRTGEDVRGLSEEQHRALQVGAHLGASFDVDMVAEVLGRSANSISHSLGSCDELVEDPAQDGTLRFRDPGLMRHLLEEQRIQGPDRSFRWRQGALHDLRRLAEALVHRLEGDDIDTVNEALSALRVLRSALEHGGDLRRSRGLLRRSLAPLLKQPNRFQGRKRVTLELVSFFLDRGYLPPDLEVALHRERLCWEYGTRRTQDLPRASMEAAERFLVRLEEYADLNSNAVARLQVEIACRRIDIQSGPEDDPLPLLDALLQEPLEPALQARALYERARYQWRRVKAQDDPTGLYPGILDSLNRACDLAREAGDEQVLARALRQKAASLSIPPKGAPKADLDEQVKLLEASLEIETRRGDAESQAVIYGTLGRAYLYDEEEPTDGLEAHMERAVGYLRRNLELSAELGLVDGQIRAATQAAQAEWKRGGWEDASSYLATARRTLEALVGAEGGMDLAFIVAGEAAEAVRSGDDGTLAALEADIERARGDLPEEIKARLREFYKPHLNGEFPA